MATTLKPTQPRTQVVKDDNNSEEAISNIIATRKPNGIYFIFYFFLWMFIGSLWILPPLLFHKIMIQCNLSLISTSLLFCIYYTLNGVVSLISRIIMNSDYLMKTHLLSSILILFCIISFQFMPLTSNYFHQVMIWITISIVDGYLNNAAPVYLYRIYHIEASVMLTLCTIIANFTMIIISMSSVNSGLSYGGTLNFISFFGVVSCLGLIVLKTPRQTELNDAIKECRNEIIEKKLEIIIDRKELQRAQEQQQSPSKAMVWNSMRNSVLFNPRQSTHRSSISATLSSYLHEHAPEISFNPSVINAINAANKESEIQYPINATLQTAPSSPNTMNTFASTNVRKMANIIAYCSNPAILAHSLNDSTCHQLELIWKEIDDVDDVIQTPTPFIRNNDDADDDKDDEKEIVAELRIHSPNKTETETEMNKQTSRDTMTSFGGITEYLSSATNTPHKLAQMSTRRRVLFSENVLTEHEQEQEDDAAYYPSTTFGNKTAQHNPYWFDIEKRFESFSLISKRADTVLASYVMNDADTQVTQVTQGTHNSGSLSNDKSYDVTFARVSTLRTSVMKPIAECYEIGENTSNCENDCDLKKSKQTLFLLILLITMIYSAQKTCYLTFISIYLLYFVGVGDADSIQSGIWLITIYLFGNLLGRILIIFVLKRYSAKNVLLISQLMMLMNCIVLLMVDWLHIGIPKENKESRQFSKIMLYLILFIAGTASSPINVISFSFLNTIQKVTQFLSTIINITASASNAISIVAMALIINTFGIETFPYYIMLILFAAIIIAIAINIKYMLFTQTRRNCATS